MIIKKSTKKVKHSSATVVFDLTNEIDASNLNRICKLSDVYSALYEFANDLRLKSKHYPGKPSWSEVHKRFWLIMSAHNVDPYED